MNCCGCCCLLVLLSKVPWPLVIGLPTIDTMLLHVDVLVLDGVSFNGGEDTIVVDDDGDDGG